ncbi:MAG TPA: cache domain-containing protein [Kofleriaceae bacterium]|nr:cache domain-containing protein [Kofleriaceae bacterium]
MDDERQRLPQAGEQHRDEIDALATSPPRTLPDARRHAMAAPVAAPAHAMLLRAPRRARAAPEVIRAMVRSRCAEWTSCRSLHSSTVVLAIVRDDRNSARLTSPCTGSGNYGVLHPDRGATTRDMELRWKVVLLGVVSLLAAAGLIAMVVQREGKALALEQVKLARKVFASLPVDPRMERELRALVDDAIHAIPDLDREARDPEAVLNELRAYSKGLQTRIRDAHDRDIYFYVYNMDTKTCLMNERHPDLEGNEQSHLKDDLGNPILAPLLEAAATRKGLVRYRWQRPTTGQWVEKVGYVRELAGRWMIGTGLYEDGSEIAKNLGEMNAQSSRATSRTLLRIAAIATTVVLLSVLSIMALNVSQQRLADAKLRKLMRVNLTAKDDERRRISHVLHDEVMQDLAAVRWQLDAVLRALESQRVSAELVKGLKTVLVSFADARERIRTLSHDLRFCVKGTQLGARMQLLAAELEVRARLDATVDVRGPVWTLSDEAATALYIVAMLALDNVERHTCATRVSVRVVECDHPGEPGFELRVRDDGHGFSVRAVEDRADGGIGLLHMREALTALGGRLVIRSGAAGTEIAAFMPAGSSGKAGAHGNA